ncbi:Ribonuclease toxin, BrnT, of type II toxin-antitoxin system [Vreelandella subterranea]|uniref:Ribonuclease toxin, BrnT, of type II toxin-antitoxin system n=2 Tax=Vreelandella subterranea TaxID=416874 RepID=A0A1H9VFP5_9GAMM|nr:Ribonuclease toxin, BrnT, of type II toxin-antitoxin system [Halomonas subterranea]
MTATLVVEYKKHTMCYALLMKAITWNPEKNKLLQEERNISFEDVVLHISTEGILDMFEHPNQERYPGQQIHVIEMEGYAYQVPFVESEDEVFLKTIIPSRKATETYLGGPK